MPSSNHTRKKQFQPAPPLLTSKSNPAQQSITSFFDRLPGYTTYSTPPSPPLISSSQPITSSTRPSRPLPSTIQSDLLNVGMRVRKSIPEGYQNKALTSPTKPSSYSKQQGDVFPVPSSAPAVLMKNEDYFYKTELQPMCGLLKIGGLNVPELSNSNSSSFSSTYSVQNDRKRGRDDEEEDDEDVVEDELDAYFLDQEDNQNDRIIARPGIRATHRRNMFKSDDDINNHHHGIDFKDDDVEFLQPMEVDSS